MESDGSRSQGNNNSNNNIATGINDLAASLSSAMGSFEIKCGDVDKGLSNYF
jgi:hypothetical protein